MHLNTQACTIMQVSFPPSLSLSLSLSIAAEAECPGEAEKAKTRASEPTNPAITQKQITQSA